jgi:hypothetical protein
MSSRGPIAGLLVLLAALGAAGENGEAPWVPAGCYDPTPMAWPGGERDLAGAVAWLRTNGNEVSLAPGLDGRRVAPVAFVTGTWWEAVLAVCAAYRLYVLPPRDSAIVGSFPNQASRVVAPETGPVVLALRPGEEPAGRLPDTAGAASPADDDVETLRRDPVALRDFLRRRMAAARGGRDLVANPAEVNPDACYRPAGLLLVTVADAGVWTVRDARGHRAEARMAYRLRLEPRFTAAQVGPCVLTWERATADPGIALSFTAEPDLNQDPPVVIDMSEHRSDPDSRSPGRGAPLVNQFHGINAYATGFLLEGYFQLGHLARIEKAYDLKVGDSQPLCINGKTMQISFAAEGEGAGVQHQVVINYRNEDGWFGLPEPVILFPNGEKAGINETSFDSRDGSVTQTYVLEKAQAGVHRVTVVAALLVGRPRLPVTLRIDLPE